MKVFIVGGTGFIGYHATKEFLRRGYEVSTISIPDVELGDWFPKEVTVSYGNVFTMDKKKLIELFEGFDAMVYAVGPDDRVKPDGDAYNFFHSRLVEACGHVIGAAREAGVKQCVVLNSYFAYFDRIRPQRRLAEHHPYIKCRIEQAERVIQEGGDSMDVMILELPYIFGSMPERTPLWKNIFLDDFLDKKIIYFPKGGSNMVSVETVAEAIVGAVENGKHAKRYPIGDVNMDWRRMFTMMFRAIGMKKRVSYMPRFIMNLVGLDLYNKETRNGVHGGLNMKYLFNDIQTRYLYFDPSETINELKYTRRNISQAIYDTMNACYPSLIIEKKIYEKQLKKKSLEIPVL